MRVLVTVGVLFLFASNAQATTVFDDGWSHDIDYEISEYVTIKNDDFFHRPTVCNILQDGSLKYDVDLYGSSGLNNAGNSGSTKAHDQSQVTLLEGGYIDGYLQALDDNEITVLGEAIKYD